MAAHAQLLRHVGADAEADEACGTAFSLLVGEPTKHLLLVASAVGAKEALLDGGGERGEPVLDQAKILHPGRYVAVSEFVADYLVGFHEVDHRRRIPTAVLVVCLGLSLVALAHGRVVVERRSRDAIARRHRLRQRDVDASQRAKRPLLARDVRDVSGTQAVACFFDECVVVERVEEVPEGLLARQPVVETVGRCR